MVETGLKLHHICNQFFSALAILISLIFLPVITTNKICLKYNTKGRGKIIGFRFLEDGYLQYIDYWGNNGKVGLEATEHLPGSKLPLEKQKKAFFVNDDMALINSRQITIYSVGNENSIFNEVFNPEGKETADIKIHEYTDNSVIIRINTTTFGVFNKDNNEMKLYPLEGEIDQIYPVRKQNKNSSYNRIYFTTKSLDFGYTDLEDYDNIQKNQTIGSQ